MFPPSQRKHSYAFKHLEGQNLRYDYIIAGVLLIIGGIYITYIGFDNKDNLSSISGLLGGFWAIGAILALFGLALIGIDFYIYFKKISYYR